MSARQEATAVKDAADWPSATPAALAALAEAGVVFLPLRELLQESAHVSAGPIATYPAFLVVFVGAVALGTGLRRRKTFVPAALIGAFLLAAVQLAVWGSADPGGWLLSLFLFLLVAARILSLAYRDWQDPIADSFAAGAGLLLLEMALGPNFQPPVRSLLPVVVPLFFLASMASRAASVRLVTRPPPEQRDGSQSSGASGRRLVHAVAGLAILGLVLAVAAVLGAPGGVFEGAGRLAYLAFTSVLTAFAFLVVRVVLPPAAWLFARVHFSLRPLQAIERNLNNLHPVRPLKGGSTSLWARVLGFVISTGAFALLLTMTWRRFSRLLVPAAPPQGLPEFPSMRLAGWSKLRRMSSRISRWEPPADTVRRWYGEALLVLARRGLEKAPSVTPGEFLPGVVSAFPECAGEFTALTRAYEDVRYGSRSFERQALYRLEAQRDSAMEVFRRKERSDDRHQA